MFVLGFVFFCFCWVFFKVHSCRFSPLCVVFFFFVVPFTECTVRSCCHARRCPLSAPPAPAPLTPLSPHPRAPSTPALSLLVQLFFFLIHLVLLSLSLRCSRVNGLNFFVSFKRCVSWSVRQLCVLSLVYVVPACARDVGFFSSASVTVHATTLVPGYCRGACWGGFYLKLL